MELIKDYCVPNKPDNTASVELGMYDTFISKGSPLNTSDYFITLFETGDTALAKTFFDKSREEVWKDPIRQDFYDTNKKGRWHSSEMLMSYLYENVQPAYKYMLWTKEVQEVIKEIFLYPAPLEGDNICKAKKYVGVGETYESAEDAQVICDNDNLED